MLRYPIDPFCALASVYLLDKLLESPFLLRFVYFCIVFSPESRWCFTITMFNKLISKSTQRMLRGFQESIRPVVDRSVWEAFERSRTLFQEAVESNPVHSWDPGSLEILNKFLSRYEHLIQITIRGISLGLTAYGLHLSQLSFDAQIEINTRLAEARERMDADREAAGMKVSASWGSWEMLLIKQSSVPIIETLLDTPLVWLVLRPLLLFLLKI